MKTSSLIRIHDLDHEGRGVGHWFSEANETTPLDTRVVFVSGALPNEIVSASHFSEKKKYWKAQLMAIHAPSSQRVDPLCAHYDLCGGCSQQHLEASAQVAYKQRWLEETFARIALVKPENWATPIYGPSWHYRRRARLSVRYVEKKSRLLVGFREKGGRFVADLHSCKILAQPFDTLIPIIAKSLEQLDAKRHIPQLEISVGDLPNGQLDPVMILRHMTALSANDLHQLTLFSQTHNIAIYLQPNATNINLLAPAHHTPRFHLPEQGIVFEYAPSDFIQINALGNQALVNRALSWLSLKKDDQVLDAFCGLGNFSLPLAKNLAKALGSPTESPHVLGIEGNEGLVQRARRNLSLNQLEGRGDFFVDNLFEPSSATIHALNRVNKVLLDPPRDGAEALCRALPNTIERVVYVSCHPATLARDTAILVHERGFRCISAGVINLFPHTSHVESIALFVR